MAGWLAGWLSVGIFSRIFCQSHQEREGKKEGREEREKMAFDSRDKMDGRTDHFIAGCKSCGRETCAES